jgi:hypothetical protein
MVVPAVAVKLAVVAPDAIVTDAGTVSRELLLDRVVTEPLAGAAAEIVTVQVLAAPGPSEAGAHDRELTAGTVITPLAATVMLMPAAVELAAIGFDNVTAVVVAVAAIVTLAYATTPEAIVLLFNPVRTQVDAPTREAHMTLFPADVAAGPAVMTRLEIWLEG